MKIFLCLLTGDKNISELTRDVATRETTILHVLKEFKSLSLVTKSKGRYRLTSIGMINAKICKDYSQTVDVLEEFKAFWLPHDISSIPTHLMIQLGYLKGSILVKTETSELGKVHQTFLEVLMSANQIKGASPIFHSDFVTTFKQLLDKGGKVELILTSLVLKKILATAESDLLKKYMTMGNLKIYVKDDLKVALTVTESAFSLGLFALNGEYDYNMDLVSLNPQSVHWGHELFKNLLLDAGGPI
ncbi:MAG: DUF1724 domain-containing protein [Crenarchaeota archaeon]|nr:DUF1724 domain-containing protein [Thermoproteota archaeon]